VDNVLVPVLGAADHVIGSVLKRLFFESYSLGIASLKRQLERSDDEPPRKMPTLERSVRLKRIQDRFAGMALDRDLEPSHKLADLAAQMCEDQALLYTPWDSCTKRSQELFGRKFAADGMQPVADMTSDLKVKQALQRRGVALEMAQLMTFEAHQKIIDPLFLEIMREPVPGFRNAI
jgi:hypothetical protein